MAKFFKLPAYQGGNYSYTGRPLRTIGGGLGGGAVRGAAGRAGGFSTRRTHTEIAKPRPGMLFPKLKMSWTSLIPREGRIPRTATPSARGRTIVAQAGQNPVRQLIKKYGAVPKEIRLEVRKALRWGGNQLKALAMQNASWSTRIPASFKVSTSLSWKHAGVRVWSDASIAPHARPFEGITGTESFWKPVYGNYGNMVLVETRPSLRPAIKKLGPAILEKVDEMIGEAVQKLHKE